MFKKDCAKICVIIAVDSACGVSCVIEVPFYMYLGCENRKRHLSVGCMTGRLVFSSVQEIPHFPRKP